MSILEVMFAILVTTVGLLGAVAVFPVASSMARKGRINDQAAASGRSAFHDFDARGMRQPARWIGYAWNWTQPPQTTNGFAPILQMAYPTGTLPLGTAFCIDPRAIAEAMRLATDPNNPDPTANQRVSIFPAVPRTNIQNVPNTDSRINSQVVDPRIVDPRMFRIGLTNGVNISVPPTYAQATALKLWADSIFTFDDDLAYDRPDEDRSLPAAQLPNTGPAQWTANKRETEGHFSWMATLVPKTEMVQTIINNRILFAPKPTDEYVLSIVVYHDRDMVEGERLVSGQVQGDGSTGGEILLSDNSPDRLKLKPGDWVVLAGTYVYREYNPSGQPIGDRLSNVPAFQWYRVTNCDDVTQVSGNPAQRYATLMGQDWNSQALVNPWQNSATAQGSVQVTIVENVAAVYEKTVRLEY